MTPVLANSTAFGNLTNFPYLMWYLMTAPPFILPTKPTFPEVQAVSGEKAALPCNISQTHVNDTMVLLLWYKDESRRPLYTIDSRKVSLTKAKHFPSSDLGMRGFFDVASHPMTLLLDPVLHSDDGVYKCQIEFKNSPTLRYISRLRVIALPEELAISDGLGRHVHGTIGPFAEGYSLSLVCQSMGGMPPPIVSWWLGSMLVDNSYTLMDDGSVTNELTLTNLTRTDLGTTYTCHAANTNLSVPLSSSVTIDMALKPSHVGITTEPSPLYAGRRSRIDCVAWGTRPKPMMTWWIGNETIETHNETSSDDFTASSLFFVPRPSDDGKRLFCRAQHPTLPNSAMDDMWNITVYYRPVLRVTEGTNVHLDRIKEGMDIYFECHVSANPPVDEVQWFFGRQILYSNTTSGVFSSNQSLAIRNVKKERSGRYQCSGSNTVGQGWSEPVFLRIKHAPVCNNEDMSFIMLPLNKPFQVECPVQAHPSPTTFHWTLNNTHGIYYLNWSTSSIPVTLGSEKDYGIVTCSSANIVGAQARPCSMRLIPEEEPQPIKNCSIKKNSDSTLLVACKSFPKSETNFQRFHLEVFDEVSKEARANITVEDVPVFLVDTAGGFSHLMFTLYTSIGTSRSEVTNFTVSSRGAVVFSSMDTKHAMATHGQSRNSSSMLSVIASAVAFLVLLAIVVAVIARKFFLKADERLSEENSDKGCEIPLRESMGNLSCQNVGSPDVIPNVDSKQIGDWIKTTADVNPSGITGEISRCTNCNYSRQKLNERNFIDEGTTETCV